MKDVSQRFLLQCSDMKFSQHRHTIVKYMYDSYTKIYNRATKRSKQN